MRIRKAAIFVAASLLLGSSWISAQMRAPWTLPESDFGGATPINEAKWIGFEDYPLSSIRAKETGYVVVEFTISAEGRVLDCDISRSSGHSRLDRVPCRLLEKRARFVPAKDENGIPRETRGTTAVSFWTPG